MDEEKKVYYCWEYAVMEELCGRFLRKYENSRPRWTWAWKNAWTTGDLKTAQFFAGKSGGRVVRIYIRSAEVKEADEEIS